MGQAPGIVLRKNNEMSGAGCSRSAFQSVFVMQPSEDRGRRHQVADQKTMAVPLLRMPRR
jgi:hypothetical protein